MGMIQFHPKTATPLTHKARSSRLALPLLAASALLAFATAPVAQGASVVANSSGSLLSAAATTHHRPASVGALTLKSFDGLVPTTTPDASFYSPMISSVPLRAEPPTFANVTRVPELMTWFAALLAAGTSLLLARTCVARHRVAPVQNT